MEIKHVFCYLRGEICGELLTEFKSLKTVKKNWNSTILFVFRTLKHSWNLRCRYFKIYTFEIYDFHMIFPIWNLIRKQKLSEKTKTPAVIFPPKPLDFNTNEVFASCLRFGSGLLQVINKLNKFTILTFHLRIFFENYWLDSKYLKSLTEIFQTLRKNRTKKIIQAQIFFQQLNWLLHCFFCSQ